MADLPKLLREAAVEEEPPVRQHVEAGRGQPLVAVGDQVEESLAEDRRLTKVISGTGRYQLPGQAAPFDLGGEQADVVMRDLDLAGQRPSITRRSRLRGRPLREGVERRVTIVG
ncbi:MAG: hypothetical protein JWN02_2822 [Acidobacteria bacterium]|nr:hypothetical protein [Acidobacteriota bacterium]